MSFGNQIQAFADKAADNQDKVLRSVLIKMGNSLVRMSPVGNPDIWLYKDPKTGQYLDFLANREPPDGYVGGRFRANWQFNVNQPASGTIEQIDRGGGTTINRLTAAIQGINAGGKAYITNNLPYSIRLEYGWSTQAPNGMVRPTVDRFRRLLKQSVKELR